MGTNLPEWFLEGIKKLSKQVEDDPQLAFQFTEDPASVLRERHLDLEFPAETDTGYADFGQLMEGLDEDARIATIESISSISGELQKPAREEPQVALALANAMNNANAKANANAGANANALANANARANSNANTNARASSNTRGAGLLDPGEFVMQTEVFESYLQSELARRLAEMQLSPARQTALLRYVALDDSSLVTSEYTEEGEKRVSRYMFRGQAFEVEALLTHDAVKVTNATPL